MNEQTRMINHLIFTAQCYA